MSELYAWDAFLWGGLSTMTSCTHGGFMATNNSHSLLYHFGSRFGTAAYVCLHPFVINPRAVDFVIKLFLEILSDVDVDGQYS
jgi:hypothetical protein